MITPAARFAAAPEAAAGAPSAGSMTRLSIRSVAGPLYPPKAASTVVEHDARVRDTAMSTVFDSITSEQGPLVLGRSVHAGYIDLPFVVNEVLVRGDRSLGGAVAVDELSVDEVHGLEAQLADYEQDVLAQIAAVRKKIDARLFVLDVTGRLPLAEAA